MVDSWSAKASSVMDRPPEEDPVMPEITPVAAIPTRSASPSMENMLDLIAANTAKEAMTAP